MFWGEEWENFPNNQVCLFFSILIQHIFLPFYLSSLLYPQI